MIPKQLMYNNDDERKSSSKYFGAAFTPIYRKINAAAFREKNNIIPDPGKNIKHEKRQKRQCMEPLWTTAKMKNIDSNWQNWDVLLISGWQTVCEREQIHDQENYLDFTEIKS